MVKKPSHAVGYGRPPVEHRFKPGQSGNPAGRKKGSKNLATVISNATTEKVVIKVNGRQKTVSKLEAASIQLANKAAGGDLKATKLMMDLLTGAEAVAASAPRDIITPEARQRTHANIMAALRARLMEGGDHGGQD
jgi:hypothetical protein